MIERENNNIFDSIPCFLFFFCFFLEIFFLRYIISIHKVGMNCFSKKKCVRVQPVKLTLQPLNSQIVLKSEVRVDFYSSKMTQNLSRILELLVQCYQRPCLSIDLKKRVYERVQEEQEHYQQVKLDGKQQYSTLLFFKIKTILVNLPLELFNQYLTKVQKFYKYMVEEQKLSVSYFYAFVTELVKDQLKSLLKSQKDRQRSQDGDKSFLRAGGQVKQSKQSVNSSGLQGQLQNIYYGLEIDGAFMDQIVDKWGYLDILESQFIRNENILRGLIKIQRHIEIEKNERKYESRLRYRNRSSKNESQSNTSEKFEALCRQKVIETKKRPTRKVILPQSESKEPNKFQSPNKQHYNRERSFKTRTITFKNNKVFILSKKCQQKLYI